MLAYETIIEIRADEVMTGDLLDTKCGIADLAWVPVLRVHVLEVDHPDRSDRIRIELDSDGICPAREMAAGRRVRVIPGRGRVPRP